MVNYFSMKSQLTVAIVPARGGSKGVKNKNIRRLQGRPLIEHTLRAARRSKLIDKVVVSTDSPRIRRIAEGCGGMVPFLRPKALARDRTPGISPIIHAVDWLETNLGWDIATVVVLQPTSPLRLSSDIDGAIRLLARKKAQAVCSVSQVTEHPHWMKKMNKGGKLTNYIKSKVSTSRQDLPKLFRLNGAVYVIRKKRLERAKTLSPPGTLGFAMPIERSVDIDTLLDFKVAEALMK